MQSHHFFTWENVVEVTGANITEALSHKTSIILTFSLPLHPALRHTSPNYIPSDSNPFYIQRFYFILLLNVDCLHLLKKFILLLLEAITVFHGYLMFTKQT